VFSKQLRLSKLSGFPGYSSACAVEAVWVEAKMYQEDGRLRYIEGVDNGDAPAHDGTFEAGHLMNHVSDSVVICGHIGVNGVDGDRWAIYH
jgi:hypothetical protein